jgi:hypothetical protein
MGCLCLALLGRSAAARLRYSQRAFRSVYAQVASSWRTYCTLQLMPLIRP